MAQSIKLFVPVGTQKFPFGRLIEALNGLVDDGTYKPDEIVMQSAVYPIKPKFTHYTMIPTDEFNRMIDDAELVMTHSGENTIIVTMEKHKPFLIVPRFHEYGEHVDNHQLEIAEIMEDKYDVVVCRDMANLKACIEKAKTHQYKPWVSGSANLIEYIKNIINDV